MDTSQLEAVLADVTDAITGIPGTPARPGQVALARDIETAMADIGQVAGIAPTGTGKGLAYLIPAALEASRGRRTVVSTESKALQAQLVDKDLPAVADSIERVTGFRLAFAIHKGFSNYGCPLAASNVAAELSKRQGQPAHDLSNDGLAASAAQMRTQASMASSVEFDGRTVAWGALAALSGWVLTQALGGEDADRSTYQADTSTTWPLVSVAADECLRDSCPLADICPAVHARAQAAAADIVVTNHTLLALQAGLGIPTVLSNKTLGDFDHLVVDEAHALPGIVRSSGERSIARWRFTRIVKSLSEMVGATAFESSTAADLVIARGSALAGALQDSLTAFLNGAPEREIDLAAPPYDASWAAQVDAWRRSATALLPDEKSLHSHRGVLKLRRLKSDLQALAGDVSKVLDADEALARWVSWETMKSGSGIPVLHYSSVDVAAQIAHNLYQAKPVDTEQHAQAKAELPGSPVSEPEPLPLSVTMVSATLPMGFTRDVGLRVKTSEYASPFDDAYGDSMLYVPRLNDADDLRKVARRNHWGRWSLAVDLHEIWACERTAELVAANGGSALILAAKSSAGQRYARYLREHTSGFDIWSQWDGPDSRQMVDRWRTDVGSVLVGTRSMMTGADAAGDTCSLVVLDRVPRNPTNVVDEARVTLLTEKTELDYWAAARSVYVSDASLLLEQATGRLIRRTSDAGMVAVLDPRLMKGTPLSYKEPDRAVYMRALRRFVHRTGTLPVATDFLAERRRRQAA